MRNDANKMKEYISISVKEEEMTQNKAAKSRNNHRIT